MGKKKGAATAKKLTLQERFEEFDQAHPEVYREFRRLAFRVLKAGIRHYGAGALFEVLRFRSVVSGKPEEPFKINNSYRSRYARKLAQEDARFARLFEFRELKAA